MRVGKRSWIAGLCVLCGAIVLVGLSVAQPNRPNVRVEQIFPERPVLFAHMVGADATWSTFEETAAHEALFKSGLAGALQNAIEEVSWQSDEARLFIEAAEATWKRGVSFSVNLDGVENGTPHPWALAVAHEAGENAGDFARLVDIAFQGRLQTRSEKMQDRIVTSGIIPGTPGFELGWWTEGAHLVIVAGPAAVPSGLAVVTGERPSLADSELWKRLHEGADDFTLFTGGWLELGILRDAFGQLPLPQGRRADGGPIRVADVVDALGVGGIDVLMSQSGSRGRSLWSEFVIDGAPAEEGLAALCSQPTMTIDDLPPLPEGTLGLGAFSFEVAESVDTLWNTFHRLASMMDERAAERMTAFRERAQDELGLDLRDDLCAHLGHVHSFYMDSAQGSFGLGTVLASSVKNEEDLKASIDVLLDRLETELPSEVRVTSMVKYGREFQTVNILQAGVVVPTICVSDGWMVIGLLPQSVDAFFMRLDGALPRWEPTGAWGEALADVPSEFTSIRMDDPRSTYQFLSSFAPTVISLMEMGMRESGEFGDDFSIPISPLEIPPAELVARPLHPNIVVTVYEDGELKTISRTSLPGIPLLGGMSGGAGMATSGVLVALLLPAVQQARTAARRTQSMNNLKVLALAMHNHHDIYRGFPVGTVPNLKLDPEERLSWIVEILPLLEQQALSERIDRKRGWEDAGQLDALSAVIPTLINPGMDLESDFDGYALSHYVGIAGVGADAPTLPVNHERAGVFAYDRATRIRDIRDGTSNTIMITETTDPAPWGAGAANIRALTERPYVNGADGIGGPYPGGFNAGLCDGSVRFLSENIDPAVLEALSTINGREVITADDF